MAADSAARGAWVERRRQVCAQQRDDGYSQCTEQRDEGYSTCSQQEDHGYSSCSQQQDQGHNECCTWWPCSWACDALVWVSNVVCVAWTWVQNLVCVAWTWVSNVVCVAWTWVSNVVCVLWTEVVDKLWIAKTWAGGAVCAVGDFVGKFVAGVGAWIDKRFGEAPPEGGDGPCQPAKWAPKTPLAHAVVDAGFFYDPKQDIIYSRMEPVQRDFGYAYGYDAAAILMETIIHCEPIFFDYDGKSWMIELWKGQYGIETGCEIGVYTRDNGRPSAVYGMLDATVGVRRGDPNKAHSRFFDCASDDDRLVLASKLFRKGEELFCRGPSLHWWLTGFKWGVLSDPMDLTMNVEIHCKDADMKTALVDALHAMGYDDVQTDGNTVTFVFGEPKTHQPIADVPEEVLAAVRAAEAQNVRAYNSLGLTSNDPNTIPAEAAATIGNAFAIFSAGFFSQVIANAAQQAGFSVAQVAGALVDRFSVAVSEAAQFVTNAGFALRDWVNGIADVIGEALDFSCIVEVSNAGGPHELVRDGEEITTGTWAVEPPATIAPGGTARFWLKDPKPTPLGSEGSATYAWTDGGRRTARFSFSDPTAGSNAAASSSSEFSFFTKSGDVSAAWGSRGSVATSGHPFFVAFVWGNGAPPPS